MNYIKLISLATAAAAVLGTVSCKEDNPLPSIHSSAFSQGEIRFTVKGAQLQAGTRAFSVSTLSSLLSDGFAVKHFVGDTPAQVASSAAVNEGTFVWDAVSSCFKPDGAAWYYPEDVKSSFFAWYPAATDLSAFSIADQTDIIVACAPGISAGSSPVPLSFEHLLSQLEINCIAGDTEAVCKLRKLYVTTGDSSLSFGPYPVSGGSPSAWQDIFPSYVLSTNGSAVNLAYPSAGVYDPSDPADTSADKDVIVPAAGLSLGDPVLSYGQTTVHVEWEYLQNGVVVGSYSDSAAIGMERGRKTIVNATLNNSSAAGVQFTVSVTDWTATSQEISLSGQ